MVTFKRLNQDWNAAANVPFEEVKSDGSTVILDFKLNHWLYKQFTEHDVGILTFTGCSRWRAGGDNDQAFFHRQRSSRYAHLAPAWGEFYELVGEDPLRDLPTDWNIVADDVRGMRHFLFYLLDDSYEFLAADWAFSVDRSGARTTDVA
jgi:hypothetical protein